MAMKRPSIDVRIGHLELHGFDADSGAEFAGALSESVRRILVERGLPADLARGAEIDHIDSISVLAGDGARALSDRVASAVHGRLER